MCFHGALDVTSVFSSSQSPLVGFEGKDQPGDPNGHLYSLVSLCLVSLSLYQGNFLWRQDRKQEGL